MSAETRPIVAYIRRDDISWWAGCEYADKAPYEIYIAETSCVTQAGALRKSKRVAAKARRLRDRGLAGYKVRVGEPS